MHQEEKTVLSEYTTLTRVTSKRRHTVIWRLRIRESDYVWNLEGVGVCGIVALFYVYSSAMYIAYTNGQRREVVEGVSHRVFLRS